VIRAALAAAQLSPDQVDAVEAHGTGTKLGDPIEAQALLATYGQGREEDRPLWLGSVKSNIGHAQAAAGVAGVIKMVLAMRHQMLPPTLHVAEPSPHVDWSAGNVRLLAQPTPWPAGDRPRRAGVSAFGISGTNAHTILEEAPPEEPEPVPASGTDGRVALPVLAVGEAPVAWLVSGRSAAALRGQAGRLAGWLAAGPELDPGDVAWSLAVTRSVFEHRAVVLGADGAELACGLAALAAGQPLAGAVTGAAGGGARVAFLFAGQGAQRAGMGAGLYAASPVFAAQFDRVCGLLEARLGAPVADVVLGRGDGAGERADQTMFAQAGLFAVQAGLVAVLAACGLVPDAVSGHSVGEIAAAWAAGVLSLEDACTLVAVRARLMQELPGGGAMCAIAASEAEAAAAVQGVAGVDVAAVNGPASVVISGDAAGVDKVAAGFAARGRRVRRLRVSHAFHSARMDPVLDGLDQAAAGLAHAAPRLPWACGLTGQLVTGADPGYWARQARQPVRYADAVAALAAEGISVFVEIGPDGTLSALGPAVLAPREDGGGPAFIPVQRPGQPASGALLAALAGAHVHGAAVDWAAVLPAGSRIDLPTYAFQRQRYWPAPAVAGPGDVAAAGLGAVEHPLLGAAVDLPATGGYLLTGRLSVRTQPWLADHVMAGHALVPGAALVEVAIRAADVAGCRQLEELTLEAPLVLPSCGTVQLQAVVAGPAEDGQRAIEIYARPDEDGPWTRHASGLAAPLAPPGPDLAVWPPPGADPVDVSGLYDGLAAAGYGYGPAFRGLRAAWRRGTDIFAEVALPDAAGGGAWFGVHPALLDAALHAALLGEGTQATAADGGAVRLPFAYAGVALHAAGASVLRVRLSRHRGRHGEGESLSLAAADGAGRPAVSVRSLVSRPAAPGQLDPARAGLRDALFTVDWVPVPGGQAADRWAVIGADELGLAGLLAALGREVRSYPGPAELARAISAGEPAPEIVLACAVSGTGAGADLAEAARDTAGRALGLVQRWLEQEQVPAPLAIVTAGAVAAAAGEGTADLPAAAVWGLVRTAQSENPGRLILADLPAGAGTPAAGVLAAAVCSGEPEVVVRDQRAYARRIARAGREAAVGQTALAPPGGGQPWRLDVARSGTLDGLALVPCPEATGPLAAGQVRIAVRAAGMNFRDVLIGLGMYPGDAVIGSEAAGVVLKAGPGVTGLAAGDRVFGLVDGGFGPVAVADDRLLAPIPEGWSFARAASVPVAFATAWYALADLAGARPGQRVLIHAATGGVGMAAVTIGRHLGLEVFGTASPGKHRVLAGLGLDADHVASSRSAEFEEAFLAATGGAGMDIVLNALAGELTDASLRLLPRGGAFIEMGKTDVRDPARVAADHPGVRYRPFVTGQAGPDRLGEILTQVTGLLAAGTLAGLPVRAWDVRRAREAFRFMSQARHTGKIVLTIPPDPAAPREPGTVLVTGGTGTLGGLVARRLAEAGQARALVLLSRSGAAAPGAAAVAAAVAASGAPVRVIAADAADRVSLAGVLDGTGPLAGVVHTAAVLDDGVTGSLTPERIGTVLRPKAGIAWNLHELTRDMDLTSFVLFSSFAATIGAVGQGSYAAANAFLDGLAAWRQAAGLPGTSLAWGLWMHRAGIGRNLGGGQLSRISRSVVVELGAEEGLALLEEAMSRDEALLVPARLDVAGLRAQVAGGGQVAPLWRGLVGGSARPAAATAGTDAQPLREQLAGLPPEGRDRVLLDLVRAHAAAVLGHASAEAIEPGHAFTDLGFDSLTAVELRNRLHAATGLRLPATLVFDYPAPAALAAHLHEELAPGDSGDDGQAAGETRLRAALATIPLSRLRDAGLLEALLELTGLGSGAAEAGGDLGDEAIDTLDAESLVRMAFDGEAADL
jgi:acyl transferase domain-containing protein/NADPH:quinone reductase-like Zn-dependent oxidoreductase/acyl carrier protein